MSEVHLAKTVHHKGRRYLAGTSSEQIGAVAGEFGDHVWIGGKGPGEVTGEGNPRAGVLTASPQVPTPSALPTPGARADAEPEAAAADGGDTGSSPRKAAGRRGANS